MGTKNLLQHLILGALLLTTGEVVSQVSTGSNVAAFGTDFLGWNSNAINNFPLRVRHDLNQPIEWYTDAVRRMRLQETAAYGIGSFPNQVKDGSLLLCPKVDGFYSNGAPGPYSLLHLAAASGAAQDDSYRPWMDVGVTFTGNKDHGYVGQKPNGSDYTDMVAHWSDNPGEHLKDRFRFIFTSGYDNHAATGAQSAEGLEFMRMWPSRYEDPRIGVGDFYAANLSDPVYVTEPTERVDMVNGRLRIRQLPGDNEAHERYKVMVVDDAPYPSGERGVVKWVDPSVFATAPDCEWTMNAAAPNHVSTAFGSADPNCPDAGDAVGIGVDLGSTVAVAKATVRSASFAEGLHVNNSTTGAGFIIGGRFEAVGGSGTSLSSGTRGIAVTSTGAGPNAVGRAGNFISNDNSRYTNGVHAETFGGSYEAAAVYAWCHSNATTNIGVMGRVDSSGTGYWAGYFMGDVQITGDLYHGTSMIFSDENLKEQVEDVDGTSELLHALRPKRFHYTAEAQERMGLPDTRQFGFIAQEVEEVLPELVSATTLAAERDTAGQEIHPPQDLKAVNYAGLIPLLVAGYQEQQRTIGILNDRLDVLQEQLAACCANPDGSRMQAPDLNQPSELDGSLNGNEKLRIQPNPFNESTTVYYTLDRGGRTQLLANSADGRELRVLQDANLEAGSYQFEWNTASLASGMYYVTLLRDGLPVVKKAVKVDRWSYHFALRRRLWMRRDLFAGRYGGVVA